MRLRGAVALILAAAGSCGPAEPEVPYLAPGLQAQLAALLESGLTVQLTGLGVASAGAIELPVPYDPERRPVLNGLPAHLRYSLGDGELLVLPVEAYRAHFIGGARAAFERRFGALRAIIAAGAPAADGEIPVLPQPDAHQRFRSRVEWITFAGGRGVAFVTHFSDDASPPASDALTWVFLGLSDDGTWLVSARHPLRVDGVPASEDARRVARALDGLPAEAFVPDLTRLARAMAALQFTSPVAPGETP